MCSVRQSDVGNILHILFAQKERFAYRIKHAQIPPPVCTVTESRRNRLYNFERVSKLHGILSIISTRTLISVVGSIDTGRFSLENFGLQKCFSDKLLRNTFTNCMLYLSEQNVISFYASSENRFLNDTVFARFAQPIHLPVLCCVCFVRQSYVMFLFQ